MSWRSTLEVYRGQARDVHRGSIVLLPDAPRHVPVLCLDLEAIVDELLEYEAVKLALRDRKQPGEIGGLEGREAAMGRVNAALLSIDFALAELTPDRTSSFTPKRQRLIEGLRAVLDEHLRDDEP